MFLLPRSDPFSSILTSLELKFKIWSQLSKIPSKENRLRLKTSQKSRKQRQKKLVSHLKGHRALSNCRRTTSHTVLC